MDFKKKKIFGVFLPIYLIFERWIFVIMQPSFEFYKQYLVGTKSN
ncbi:hypothetical protein HPSA20_0760 [Helicobacter pylori SouthAfrica20]|uniref:Uncharacterized protein n=1 Tax=Helicobacter pylori SouthAfrica20 TaxID=1352356 RepID=T1UAQ4_HELPX|nr:hypothetical protein HPSA20_0760 [Helicobacter pylori SouthAfrica20]